MGRGSQWRSLFVVVALATVVSRCDNSDGDESKRTTQDILDDCWPFTSFDDRSELDFVSNGKLELIRVSGSPKNKSTDTIDSAPDVLKTAGTFQVDEAHHLVRFIIDGKSSTYIVNEPADGMQCILISGSANAANLTLSWFGTPSPPEPDPPEPDF